jgi:CRISPR-associated exonuclease Cas4
VPAPLADPETEDALIPLSALQHQLFCPRQCALIHVEGLWAEDVATAEGRVTGKADVVELIGEPPQPFPVEYKRGKPKAHRADEVQLCAQAICLEEMFGVPVPEGALFYGEVRRRHPVQIDDELRHLTARTAEAARNNILNGITPPPARIPACGRCSLQSLCQPDRLQKPPSIERWLSSQLGE